MNSNRTHTYTHTEAYQGGIELKGRDLGGFEIKL